MRFIDLSHPVTSGLVTYPGLPAPVLEPYMSFDDSHDSYEPGTEFEIVRIELVGNTGTYVDAPAHRYRDGRDLAGLDLASLASLDGVVVRVPGASGAIGPEVLAGIEVSGRAVLFATGWSRHFGTPAYLSGHPYLAEATVETLVASRPALVGIDSLNIDGTERPARPAHTALLGAGIPIVEHLRGLDELPDDGFAFFAVPPPIVGMGSFPVRAFAMVSG